jgi:ankyrin repeat protein
MLEAERRGLKPASLDQQNFMARAMLATNRLIASRIQGMATNAKDQNRFRGGVEAIQHVLPPDVQRALHSKLCSAVKNGEKEIIDMLLKFDIDLDYSDHFGTALHYAAFFGQLQASHILLDKGAFPGALNYRDQTPLHIASSKNAHTVVDLLVRYGAPLNATDMGGLTAMHMASEHGFTKVVDTLIMGGADCDKPNRVGWTPLHLASMGMHHNIIERLCISGMANPNLGCCQTRNVIMGKGTRSYIFPVVNGDTPLHFSARSSHFMCLKVLLENSADVNAVNEHNETPMHLAAHSCDLRCVERLLEYGMDFIDIEDKQGRDPIDVCDDVLSENAGLDDDSVRIRGVVNEIKTMLQRTSVKKNQQAHRALMEQAKKGVGGRKKLQNDTAPAVDGDGDNALEIEEKSMDDRTMEDKIAAMNVELLAARAEAQAAQAQSRMKTYELNESLMETRRRLVETEFMLERERESRVSLEQEVLGLIGAHEDVQNLKGGFSDKDDFDGPSTRGRSAESSYDPTRRMGTAEGTIDYGAGYERLFFMFCSKLYSTFGDLRYLHVDDCSLI